MKSPVLTVSLLLCAGAAFAQAPPMPAAPPEPPLRAPMPMPHTSAPVPREFPSVVARQQVIGNKKTHVYHFATDKSLPAPANRVPFSSVAAAVAAGYHASGKGPKMAHSKQMPHATMHGKGQPVPPTAMPPVPPQ